MKEDYGCYQVLRESDGSKVGRDVNFIWGNTMFDFFLDFDNLKANGWVEGNQLRLDLTLGVKYWKTQDVEWLPDGIMKVNS